MFLLEDGGVTLEDTGFRDEDSILVEVRHNTEGTWPEEISSVFASATGTSNAGGADRRMSTMRSSTQVAGYKTQKTFLVHTDNALSSGKFGRQGFFHYWELFHYWERSELDT